MHKLVLVLVLGWILAWVDIGWLWWLAATLCSLLCYRWLVNASWQATLLLMALLLGIKSYAMYEQNNQLPAYIYGQQLKLSGCYQILDINAFPLSLKVVDVGLLKPGLGQAAGRVDHWYAENITGAGYVQLSVYDKAAIKHLRSQPRGQIEAVVQLRQIRNYANRHGFDYVAWSKRQGQLARGYVKQLTALTDPTSCRHSFSVLHQLRAQMLAKLQHLPVSEEAKKIWQALALGHSKALNNDDWLVVNRTGTTHLLIISGLHIGLLASLILLLWKGIQPYTPIDYWHPVPLFIAWLVALLYALLSGWGLPAQRAMIMVSFVLLGGWRRIAWPLEQRLLWAALITLLWQPMSLYQSGFWFSYVAVGNLALVWRQQQRPDAMGLAHWWRANWLAQLALLTMLTPIIGAVTGGLSLVAPWLNLLLIPLFTLLLVPWVLFVSLLLLLLDSSNLLITVTGLGLTWVWQVLSFCSTWQWSYINTSHWPTAIWVAWFAVGCGLLLTARLAVLAFVTLLLMFTAPIPQQQRLTVFDVGQGLAVWLQARDKHLLYDLGDRFRSGFNLFQAVVVGELKHQGVEQIDKVVVSHWDRDHSGGISALNSQPDISVAQWLLPSEQKFKLENLLGLQALPVERCQTQAWRPFGNMKIRQFNLQSRGFQKNNASCVVQIDYNGKRILFTGDIERMAEQELWQSYGDELASDVMLAPHHGSRTSSSEAFLAYVQPRISIISAGFDNRFNHPHADVLARYWQRDVYWLNTAQHGQVQLQMNEDNWQLNSHHDD